MVGFVVEDDDVFLGAQLAADAPDHLVGRFGKDAGSAVGENSFCELAGTDLFAEQERVKVGDDDPGLAELFELMTGDDVAQTVIIIGVVGKQHTQPVANRDARADDQERLAEAGILRARELVDACQAISMAMTRSFPSPWPS